MNICFLWLFSVEFPPLLIFEHNCNPFWYGESTSSVTYKFHSLYIAAGLEDNLSFLFKKTTVLHLFTAFTPLCLIFGNNLSIKYNR